MKTTLTIFTTTAAVLAVGATLAFSQAPAPARTETTSPARHATAELFPTAAGNGPKGSLRFGMVGDAINVSGRVEGLEAGERYQLGVHGMADRAIATGTAPMNEGTPNAGQPHAPRPNAGQPQAPEPNAGQPNGQERPGAPGAGTSGTSVAAGGTPPPVQNDVGGGTLAGGENFATLTPDAAGAANVNATLRNTGADAGLQAIAGHTIILRKITGTNALAGPIASGVITLTHEKEPPADKPQNLNPSQPGDGQKSAQPPEDER